MRNLKPDLTFCAVPIVFDLIRSLAGFVPEHCYVGSVLIPPIINEYDPTGFFVRNIVPENVPRNPIGIDVGADGTLYYAELHLTATLDTGCGSVSMVRFDAAGQPQPPVQLSKNLLFPDGVTVADSARFKVDFTTLPPSPENDPSVCGGE